MNPPTVLVPLSDHKSRVPRNQRHFNEATWPTSLFFSAAAYGVAGVRRPQKDRDAACKFMCELALVAARTHRLKLIFRQPAIGVVSMLVPRTGSFPLQMFGAQLSEEMKDLWSYMKEVGRRTTSRVLRFSRSLFSLVLTSGYVKTFELDMT